MGNLKIILLELYFDIVFLSDVGIVTFYTEEIAFWRNSTTDSLSARTHAEWLTSSWPWIQTKFDTWRKPVPWSFPRRCWSEFTTWGSHVRRRKSKGKPSNVLVSSSRTNFPKILPWWQMVISRSARILSTQMMWINLFWFVDSGSHRLIHFLSFVCGSNLARINK